MRSQSPRLIELVCDSAAWLCGAAADSVQRRWLCAIHMLDRVPSQILERGKSAPWIFL